MNYENSKQQIKYALSVVIDVGGMGVNRHPWQAKYKNRAPRTLYFGTFWFSVFFCVFWSDLRIQYHFSIFMNVWLKSLITPLAALRAHSEVTMEP